MPMASVTRVVAVLFLLFLLLSVQPAYADERSFRIEEVDIHARVDSVGDMHVAEADTYRFDGAFNGIIVELDSSKSDGIDDFQAFEVSEHRDIPLRSELSSDGDRLEYKVYSPSQDESKVFRFTYTVKNVVQVYADTAELYWKFFDDRNPSELETVNIAVELPEGVGQEEVAAFGHGPLDGTVRVENGGMVRYQVSPLPSGELLEVRILFPRSTVPGSTRISADSMLDAIREEERNWAESTGNGSVYGALALLIANLIAGIYVKFGRTYRPEWKGKYYRELPGDVTPAVVGYVMKYRVRPSELMATLADLVRKRYVALEKVKEGRGKHGRADYTFRLLDKGKGGLQPHETMLIDWFFGKIGSANKVSLSGIRQYAKSRKNAAVFTERWSQWKDEVEQTANRLGFIENQNGLRRIVQITMVAQFFGLWFLAPTHWNWLMFCAIPLLFFIPKGERRTRTGQTEYVKWSAFRRFLRDYSLMASREPLAVHLWEHYFVYAISLGEAKKMMAIARLKIPDAKQVDPVLDDTFYYHSDDWIRSFQRAVQSANRSGSSGDSDGSFSSGGGGGGGGGGRGAF